MYRFQEPFFQTWRQNQTFSTTLILVTSFHRLLGHWKVWRGKVEHNRKVYSLISRQQLRLSWAASWRNLLNVIIDECTQGLTWVKMIVIMKFNLHLNAIPTDTKKSK